MESPLIALQAALPDVIQTRYLSVAGLVVLLWDHCLTFEKERQLVWPTRTNFVKVAFLGNRYLVPVALIINTHTLSGISAAGLSDDVRHSCRIWIMITSLSGIMSVAVANFLILLKIWKLWEKERLVILATILAFGVTGVGSLIIMGLSVGQMWPSIRFSPVLRMCTLTHKPEILKGLWALTILFELFVFSMVCLNALYRPRGSHTLFLKVLYRDGICFFLLITALRLLNFIVAITAPASRIFLGVYCVWSLVTTIVSRMILNLREAELKMREVEDEDTDISLGIYYLR